MDRIKQFLKGTKIASRILFVLWLFLAVFGNFANESKALEILDFAVLFLLPAIVNELCKNPIFKNRKDKFFLFMRHTKIVSRVLFQFWALTIWLGIGGGIKNLIIVIAIMTIVLILPAFLVERKNNPALNPSIEQTSEYREDNLSDVKEAKNENEKTKNYATVPQRIGGVVLMIFGGALSMLLLGIPLALFTGTGKEAIVPIVGVGLCGLLLFIIGLDICKGLLARTPDEILKKKQEKEMARRYRQPYRGVYLNEEQIRKLTSKIELPTINNTPVFLNYGEIAVWYSEATRQETKNRVVGRTGSYGGGTVRIAKGLSIHTGGSASKPIYGDVSMQFHGEFVITNERIIFLSNQRGFEIKHANITAATAYKDGFSFQSGNMSYVLLVPRADLATLAFDGVRTGEIPIAEINTSFDDDYDDFDDDCDEVDSHDVSSIDGMDGHDFEYFCADILRKNGFSEVSVTKGSGDQGVDILATKGGIKYAIQCKNYASPLSNTPIQEVNAGKTFYNCHVGVVMTNSTFTPGAKTLAQATGVLLWDRSVLQSMMESID